MIKEVKELYMKKIFIILLLIFATTLAACGKSAKPIPYPNSGYPRSYPYNQ
jgi:hypothetical protein